MSVSCVRLFSRLSTRGGAPTALESNSTWMSPMNGREAHPRRARRPCAARTARGFGCRGRAEALASLLRRAHPSSAGPRDSETLGGEATLVASPLPKAPRYGSGANDLQVVVIALLGCDPARICGRFF